MRQTRGFTLTELVIVLVMIGVIAAVTAGPRFFDRGGFEERGFYDEVLSAARYAQKYAITSGCEVQFSIASGSYSLKRRATTCTTGGFTSNVMNPSSNTAFSGTAPSGVSPFSMTNDPVVFDAQGRVTDFATVSSRTVTVGSRTFTIVGASGFVQAP